VPQFGPARPIGSRDALLPIAGSLATTLDTLVRLNIDMPSQCRMTTREQPMATTVVLEMSAELGQGDALVAAFNEILPATREFKGCQGVTVHQRADDPDSLMLIEHWASPEDHLAYGAWRKDSGTLGGVMGLGDAPAEPGLHRRDLSTSDAGAGVGTAGFNITGVPAPEPRSGWVAAHPHRMAPRHAGSTK
jgi:hypothetical protein